MPLGPSHRHAIEIHSVQLVEVPMNGSTGYVVTWFMNGAGCQTNPFAYKDDAQKFATSIAPADSGLRWRQRTGA